jgi:phosphohistidine phosphatase SixA
MSPFKFIQKHKHVLPIVLFLAVLIGLAYGVPAVADRPRGVTSEPAGPTEVLIIRHGEEPKDGPHLDDQGRARAKALVKLFQDPFSMPTALFAAKSSKHSERSVETLEPLAKALGVEIDTRFSDEEVNKIANSVLHGARHAGGNVIICWHRETIRELASALGVANPPEWPSEQYDHIWRISFSKDRKVTMTDEPMGIKLDESGQ